LITQMDWTAGGHTVLFLKPQWESTGGQSRPSWLQAQVHAESVVKFAHDRGWQPAHAAADALDSYRPDLLGLRLGISGKTGLAGLEQNLEGVNPGNVRGDGHYGDHAASQPGCRGVSDIVADDDGRADLPRF
jgi:hypothetical protein